MSTHNIGSVRNVTSRFIIHAGELQVTGLCRDAILLHDASDLKNSGEFEVLDATQHAAIAGPNHVLAVTVGVRIERRYVENLVGG